MKLHFGNERSSDIARILAAGGSESIEKFHKNLFLDEFDDANSPAYLESDFDNEEDDDEEISKSDEKANSNTTYISTIENNSAIYKLNHLSMPLTGIKLDFFA